MSHCCRSLTRRLAVSTVLLGALVAAPCAHAALIAATAPAPVTVLPNADAHVLSSSPGTNYGSATRLKLQGSGKAIAYARFAVSGLSAGASAATLRFSATTAGPGYSVRVTSSTTWGEKTITYKNRPGYGSTSLGSTGAVASGRWYGVDVSSVVTGDGTYSFTLVAAGSTQFTLASREAGASIRPQLVVTPAVAATPPAVSSPPSISGTAKQGQTLTAQPGTWTGTAPIAYAYAWQRCDGSGSGCVAIAGAGAASYTATSADVGSTLRIAVTATNSAGGATATSAPTAAVAGPTAPMNTSPPSITGTPQVTRQVSGDPGSWSGDAPIAFAYRWSSCDADGGGCQPIDGATDATYTPVAADEGRRLVLGVTATNGGGGASASSAPTAAVAAAPPPLPAPAAPPTVSGTAQDGQTLTADPGSWSGSPTSFSYTWQACNASGGSCSDIAGAGGQSLDLTSALVGSRIRVVVVATNDAGDSAPEASPATDAVAAVAPANSAPPEISGTPVVGVPISAGTGTWSGTTPITYAYQWLWCGPGGGGCTAIAGATGATYTPTGPQQDDTLRVTVTATNAATGASGVPVTSAASAPVAIAPTGGLPAHVMFGANAPAATGQRQSYIQDLESKLGRKLALVRVYDRWDQAFPTADDSWLAGSGHPMVLSVKARRMDGTYISFADIAAARDTTSPLYADIVGWAQRVKGLGVHVYFSFNPEPDSSASTPSGGAADYVAAWQNVVSIFRDQGATNAEFFWNVTAFNLQSGRTAAGYYPGDAWVDDIGADGYNRYGCGSSSWRTFTNVFDPLLTFADGHPGKDVIIPEWGTTEDAAQAGRKAGWIADMQATLETDAWERVKAVLVWSQVDGSCNFKVDTTQSAFDAWKAMAYDSYFGRKSPI
jgi:hypothetical protein